MPVDTGAVSRVESHIPWARGIARHYQRAGIETEDLEQVALLALVEAERRYDPARGVPFGGYAAATIHGRLKHHLRDRSWSAKVPRGVKEAVLVVTSAQEEMEQQHGRPPTTAALARRVDLDEEEVLEALVARQHLRRGEAGDMPDVSSEDRTEAHALSRSLCAELLQELSARERRVVVAYHFEGQTQAEIGAELGVSQVRISRLLRRAMERLRRAAGTP